MKKIWKLLAATLAFSFTLGLAVACGGGEESSPSNGAQQSQDSQTDDSSEREESNENESSDNSEEEELLEITGITFEDGTYTYDGTQKEISVSGELPEGVTVSYQNNSAIDAGTYNAKATLSGKGYQMKILQAALIINKATITGVTFKDDTVIYDGSEQKIEVVGVPDGVTVSYINNSATEAGTYEAKAILTGKNYETLELTATFRILPDLSGLADNVVESFGTVPDPWAFLPESFNPQYRVTETVVYDDFINVSDIPTNGMGKQLNVVYGELTKMDVALSYVNEVYKVLNTVKNLYTTFLDGHPEDYKHFSGTVGPLSFTLEIGETEYALSATVDGVNVVIFSDMEENAYGARVQLMNSNVLTYLVKEDYMLLASTILNVSAMQVEFIREEEKTFGYVYEFLGTETVNTSTSAMIEVNDTYTTLIGTKGDFIPTSDSRNCEVYRNSDGCLVGTEVREELTVAGLTDTYNTCWYPLAKLSGVNSIKKVDEMNGTNADTIYINGSDDTLHSKLVGLKSVKKAGSRRFDIEFKTMYFFQYDEEKEKYESVEIEIPMLFVQEEMLEDFEEDFAKVNEEALDGESVSLTVSTTDLEEIEYGYYTLLESYDLIKDIVSFENIKILCGINAVE